MKPPEQKKGPAHANVFGWPRNFLDNRFVYLAISPRARGLSVGVNMNPDQACNFHCLYCEVDRSRPSRKTRLNVTVLAAELRRILTFVTQGQLREYPLYRGVPDELLQLRHIALSGDGEPTLASNFGDALEAIVHVRALGEFPFFKLVLVTNATGLDRPQVREGLKLFTPSDEIWAKLDGGTQDYLDKLARPVGVSLDTVLRNILWLARRRPVVIQSLFPSVNGAEPSTEEIQEYAQRLKELAAAGAKISLVQIYSASRPMPQSVCGHLSLKKLSQIAEIVRQVAGLPAEVF